MTSHMYGWQRPRCQHRWFPMVATVYAGGYVVGGAMWICLNCGAVRAENKGERRQ